MRFRHIVVLAAVVAGIVVGVAVATPVLGVTSVIHARGTIDEMKVRVDGTKVKTKESMDVVTQQLVFARNGGTAGWHSHPGIVLVVVKSGSLTVYDESCARRVYGAGQGFVEPGPAHTRLVRNEGSVDSEVWATYVVPPGTTALRIDRPDPGCNVGG